MVLLYTSMSLRSIATVRPTFLRDVLIVGHFGSGEGGAVSDPVQLSEIEDVLSEEQGSKRQGKVPSPPAIPPAVLDLDELTSVLQMRGPEARCAVVWLCV